MNICPPIIKRSFISSMILDVSCPTETLVHTCLVMLHRGLRLSYTKQSRRRWTQSSIGSFSCRSGDQMTTGAIGWNRVTNRYALRDNRPRERPMSVRRIRLTIAIWKNRLAFWSQRSLQSFKKRSRRRASQLLYWWTSRTTSLPRRSLKTLTCLKWRSYRRVKLHLISCEWIVLLPNLGITSAS